MNSKIEKLKKVSALSEVNETEVNRLKNMHKELVAAAEDFIKTPFPGDEELGDMDVGQGGELMNDMFQAKKRLLELMG